MNTSDDNALVFTLRHQEDLFVSITTVFLGVKGRGSSRSPRNA